MRLGLSARCAAQQYQAANVRFGSEADILGGLRDFTPESRHKSWPKLRSAHQLRQQGDGLIASGCMVALPAQINNKSDEAQ